MAEHSSFSATELSPNLQQLTNQLVETPNNHELVSTITTMLQRTCSLVLDRDQRVRIGAGPEFSNAVSVLWLTVDNLMKSNSLNIELICALARLTRNMAADCPYNQTWICDTCEPHMRNLLHYLTSFYSSQTTDYHLLTTLLAQCLVNMCTDNRPVSATIWGIYKELTEQQNIITRLLAYPEQKSVTATLVFILNSLTPIPEISSDVATSTGGRAIYVALLDLVDRIFEDEEKADQFQLILRIFALQFERSGPSVLFTSLQPPDGIVSLHQITLLKLLDGHLQHSTSTRIDSFLTDTLLRLLQAANQSMSTESPNGQPDENLPRSAAAIVLISQDLATRLISEQDEWERTGHERVILKTLRDSSNSYVELVIDVLRQLDQLLPRIQFGKARPHLPTSAPTNDLVSGFHLVKRDLVRLLGIVVYDDKSIQDRIRRCQGVQVVLGLCAVDERNPYIREHALFTLRNLLHKNKDNQDVVKELEPMGKWDENGVLTDFR